MEDILKSIEIDPEEVKAKDNKLDELNKQLEMLYNEKAKLQKREKNIYTNFEEEIYTKEMFKLRVEQKNRLLKSFVKEIITHKPLKFKDFEMTVMLKD